MQIVLNTPSQPLRVDESGAIRVGKSRVTLDLIVARFNQGYSAEDIASHLPTLDLADVYAAITYYLQNREEVDLYLADGERESAATLAKIDALPGNRQIRDRLLSIKSKKASV